MKHYPSIKAAHGAVQRSPARGVRYAVKLEAVEVKGVRMLRYVPRFKPATDEQKASVERAKFVVAE